MLQVQSDQTNATLVSIPSEILQEDLPPVLVDGHIHLLNLSAKLIEIRPLKQLWKESSEHWRINCASGQYRMYRGHETLVEIRSPTWAIVSKYFQRLNKIVILRLESDHLNWNYPIITTSPVNSASMLRLSVTLPHFGLSFFVNEREELESRDFKYMVYDENQCVGALFGLQNLLVLRPRTHISGTLIPEALIPRRVLVLNGTLHCERKASLDQVRIAPGDRALYHVYDVDTELGCLRGNDTLTSTRFLADLHAMTSCWHRPDPLTGKTGVQAALSLLQSAACRSIMKHKGLDPGFAGGHAGEGGPEIHGAYDEIRTRYYWDPDARKRKVLKVQLEEARTLQQTAFPCPSNAAGQASLEDHFISCVPAEPGLSTAPRPTSSLRYVTLHQLFNNRRAPELPARNTLLRDKHVALSDDVPTLDQLFSCFCADLLFQQEYLALLNASAEHVHVESRTTYGVAGENLIEALKKHYIQCRDSYLNSMDILRKSLDPTIDPDEQAVDQLPTITTDVLLRYLASASPIDIPLSWKTCLTSLALILLDLQRSRRLLLFALDGLEEEFSKELENDVCDGWNPEDYPDWLLIQVRFWCPSTCLY